MAVSQLRVPVRGELFDFGRARVMRIREMARAGKCEGGDGGGGCGVGMLLGVRFPVPRLVGVIDRVAGVVDPRQWGGLRTRG